jgi:hypothetical protein
VADVLVMITDSVSPPEMVAKPWRTTYRDGGLIVTVWKPVNPLVDVGFGLIVRVTTLIAASLASIGFAAGIEPPPLAPIATNAVAAPAASAATRPARAVRPRRPSAAPMTPSLLV